MKETAMHAPLVIYHHNCADGYTAAWVCKDYFGGVVDFYAATHQNPPPDVKGRDVILVDFSYKRAEMREIQLAANSVLVLDHHKSAAEELSSDLGYSEAPRVIRMDRWATGALGWDAHLANAQQDRWNNVGHAVIYALFDMDRSGAGLAWDFFNPGKPRPPLVDYVEDRDLWKFALPGSREVSAAVFSHPYTFEAWDALAYTPIEKLVAEGAAIDRKHRKDVAELVSALKARMRIGGVDVWAANLPYTLTSDAGHLMCEGGEPFAACYWDTPDGRVFSLRSRDDGADVSAIAKQYGGGGHRNAAGFRLPHGAQP
jgi:uncharacterized protein